MKTFRVKNVMGTPVISCQNARECAVLYFGSEAVINLSFDMWMNTSGGEVIVVEEV
jgi:hypothetical protein